MSGWIGKIAMLALLALAGCISGENNAQSWPKVTASKGETLLRISMENGKSARAKRIGQNDMVATWMTEDPFTVSLQEGVLVATRGFGFDRMGARVGGTLAALAAGGDVGEYARQTSSLSGENGLLWQQSSCQMTGGATELRSGARYRKFTEACRLRDSRYSNIYWLDPGGQIRHSRQWLNPEIGYLDLSETVY